jgi:hypothetical protein
VGLERGPLSLVNTTEELLRRKSSSSGLEIREYGRKDPSRSPRGLYQQNVGTNFADKRPSLDQLVCLRTQATEFVLFVCFVPSNLCTCHNTKINNFLPYSMTRVQRFSVPTRISCFHSDGCCRNAVLGRHIPVIPNTN